MYRTILFLFYFNRVLASAVSYGIQLYTWHYYRAYIAVQSLQVSVLAGRVFFRGARYHGRNETILVQDGYITWRYWLRRVRDLDLDDPLEESGSQSSSTPTSSDENGPADIAAEAKADKSRKTGNLNLPFRVVAKCRGAQWFVYNRTPAYDAIFNGMNVNHGSDNGAADQPNKSHSSPDLRFPAASIPHNSSTMHSESLTDDIRDNAHSELDDVVLNKEARSVSTDSSAKQAMSSNDHPLNTLPSILNILPIAIECSKGAIVMGNQNTRSILTACFESASGQIDIRQSRPPDKYKQIIDLDFTHPTVQFKHNKEYKDINYKDGARLWSDNGKGAKATTKWYEATNMYQRLHEAWLSVRDLIPLNKGSLKSLSHPRPKSAGTSSVLSDNAGPFGQDRWLGLTRYLDEDDDVVEQERWKGNEYGRYPTIVDCPNIAFNIYWDVPGPAETPVKDKEKSSSEVPVDINGDMPPDWGIDLKVRGGTINYGPWADRQRADLQAVFFPTAYQDATPAKRLAPGELRVSTKLKVLVEIEKATTLLVPTREDSKDWKWKGHTNDSSAGKPKRKRKKFHNTSKKSDDANQTTESRPFGWLEARVLPDSSINFTMDLVANKEGYKNHVNLDLKGFEMSSSVNHGLLYRSRSQIVSCDLSNPPGWNTLRKWNIEIQENDLELFILRDHIFLLTDLINDWTSGPPGNFHTFIPFEYSLSFRFSNFKLFLNVNDSNIIDNPTDTDDNTFIIVWGQELIADLSIPMTAFRIAQNKITFDIEAKNGGFELRTPAWNTQHTFLDRNDVAALRDLRLNGSYCYYTTTSPNLTDILFIDIYGASLTVSLYGFLVRYFMTIKDNYFGDDMHFRTLEEYQSQINRVEGEDSGQIHHSRLSNDLDVILAIKAEKCSALLPAHLYTASDSMKLDFSSINADLRVTNYYMDLAVSTSPIAVSRTSQFQNSELKTESDAPQLYIDSLEVLGHRLFGLPPAEPTYVCNWDFDIGRINGECSIDFLQNLMLSLRCFSFTFTDSENALPPINPPVIHDITFLRAKIQPISLGLHVKQAGFLLDTQAIQIEYNDWAGSLFSDRLYALIPNLRMAIVNSRGISADRSHESQVAETYAYLTTSIEINKIKRKSGFEMERQLQQNHLALHDTRTHRIPWLINALDQTHLLTASRGPAKLRPPAMPFPLMPPPVTTLQPTNSSTTSDSTSLTSTISSRSSNRRSFFLADRASSSLGKRKAIPRRASSQNRPMNKTVPDTQNTLKASRPDSQLPSFPSTSGQTLSIESKASKDDSYHARFVFSSPYKRPHFPLLGIKSNLENLPALPSQLSSDEAIQDPTAAQNIRSQPIGHSPEQSSFVVCLNEGFRLFCTPEALLLVTELQEQLQTNEAVSLLDELQIDTMVGALNAKGEPDRAATTVEIRLFTPYVGARFISSSRNDLGIVSRQERYDVILENLFTMTRLADLGPVGPQAKLSQQTSLHITLNRLTCSARESVDEQVIDQAVVSLTLQEPVFWMFHGESSTFDLQFVDLEISSASRRVDYISSLIRQTEILSDKTVRRFAKIAKEERLRLRLLILLLTTEGDGIPDPPFLSGASYVLRSAQNHLRSTDSWKMMSRLRYVYLCLPDHSRDRMYSQCVHRWASCPLDAGTRVVASFNHWPTWDLEHVRSAILMRRVYGSLLDPSSRESNRHKPSRASIRAGRVRALVEPGSSQNEVSIDRLAIGLSIQQLPPASASAANGSSLVYTIQAHCAKFAIRLHWSLCELLENVVETVRATNTFKSKPRKSISAKTSDESKARFHVVLSSEISILNVSTINLKAVSVCRGLKTSLLILNGTIPSSDDLTTLVVNADVATSEIHSHSKLLTFYKLREPRVLGSRDGKIGTETENPWRFVGSGNDVSFEILENPLDLVDFVGRLLKDEVAHLSGWVRSLQPTKQSRPESVKPEQNTGIFKIQVALMLDSYQISAAILPSLTYQIQGSGGRVSLMSGVQHKSGARFSLDLKDHAHIFKTAVANSSKELSVLHIPPVNGRLKLDISPEQSSVNIRALVEPMLFDASAIHAILNAVNRPEIMTLCQNLNHEFSKVQDDYKRIFSIEDSMAEKGQAASESILYDASAVVSGLAVRASTPDATDGAKAAHLELNLGRILLKATNQDSTSQSPLAFSESEIRLDKIRVDLMRSDDVDFHPAGEITVAVLVKSTSKHDEAGKLVRAYQVRSNSLDVKVFTETISIMVAILGHLQDTLKIVDFTNEVKSLRDFGRSKFKTEGASGASLMVTNEDSSIDDAVSTALFGAMYSLEMSKICFTWQIGDSISLSPTREAEDLILSFTKIDLATRRDNAARLLIQDFQLQMAPASRAKTGRSMNSALLPEVVFNVADLSTPDDRRLAFHAVGKSLDLRLTSQSILPANDLRRSIASAMEQVRAATADWKASAATEQRPTKSLLGNKKLSSLLVDADFAGAVVYIQGRNVTDPDSLAHNVLRGGRFPHNVRSNQIPSESASNSSTTLRAPGIAFKVEYKDVGLDQKSINAEVKVDASTNVLFPSVVPLIMETSSSIKEIVGEPNKHQSHGENESKVPQTKFFEDERLRTADPNAVFGNCKINLGLRICKQEFSLSCQPIARVAATARFEDIYITVNTVQSAEHGKFFTISATFTGLQMSVQHVYSRESTGNFEVDSIIISLMNSKHVSSTDGISAIISISPMKAQINAKQSQDFLLFREIWVPPEIREAPVASTPRATAEPQAYIVQRYQQVAAAGAFPWNATVSVDELDIQLDLGQSLGRSSFRVSSFWISSTKSSSWEQNLCVGFERMTIDSNGRMSGLVELQNFKVRTSIEWPMSEDPHVQRPLVQASLAFDHLRLKAGFDYQAFLIADITHFEFIMYNLRTAKQDGGDRLVGTLDGDKVQVFCTTASASQALALYQAFQRLIQEKQAAYETSVQDIERLLRRKSSINPPAMLSDTKGQADASVTKDKSPLRLQTNVVVTLKALNVGAFPNSFLDKQIFKLEALDASARFAVVLDSGKIYSTLGMTLGQLRIALSGVTRANVPKTLGEVSVADVVASATGSRGGTILKVPKLVAKMQTWQSPESNHIDYIFKSSFQGKVDVGWNYSRISYIRGMWTNHARALAQRLGKPLPQSAVQITGGPRPKEEGGTEGEVEGEQEKITAVVNVPQSKYQYTALQPAIIETPQLRDMGEATPPLEWIGLHRERLPNLTHQIVIVALLEVAKEVDDAYTRILGSS